MPWFGLSSHSKNDHDENENENDSSSDKNTGSSSEFEKDLEEGSYGYRYGSSRRRNHDNKKRNLSNSSPLVIPSLNSSRSSSVSEEGEREGQISMESSGATRTATFMEENNVADDTDAYGEDDSGDDDEEEESEEGDDDDELPQLSFRPLQPCDRQRIQELHEQWFPVTYSNDFYDELVNNHRLATSGDPLFTCVATLPNVPENQRSEYTNPYGQSATMYFCETTSQQDDGDVVLVNMNDSSNNHDALRETACGVYTASMTNRPPPTIRQQHQQQSLSNNLANKIVGSIREITAGCVVGAFLHPSRLNAATQQLLVPNPQVHSRLFYIMTLGTVEEYRGYGVATQLVAKCMELVERDPTCGALYLHVIPFNHAAIRFYEKLGFYRVCTIENYYNIDNQHYDCYLYAKYYHGNRGHRTLYKMVSGAISSIWQHLRSPFSIFSSSR